MQFRVKLPLELSDKEEREKSYQMTKVLQKCILNARQRISGNALARVQRVHERADLWDITFCTR